MVNTDKTNPVTKEAIRKPSIVTAYDKYMGGVDRCDQMLSYTPFQGRTVKWWKRLFFHVLNVAVLNAYLLYKQTIVKPLRHRQFRNALVQEMIASVDAKHVLGIKPLFKTTKEIKEVGVTVPASRSAAGINNSSSGIKTNHQHQKPPENSTDVNDVQANLKKTTSGVLRATSNEPDVGSKEPSVKPTVVRNGDHQEKETESLPTLAKLGKTNSLVVNQRQRGNPILKHVRNVPWEYGNIVPDYVMGHSTCALFLSLRYHQLNPEYIHKRLQLLGKSFDLRVLLVQIDIKDPHHLLKDLAKMCILADCTLILAFSPEEAGRYLETYKVYENKPPEVIMEKTENNFMAKMTDSVTSVKSVNKTDCMTLMSTFGSLETIMKASREELSLCPGFGPQKAQRLHDVFHQPFLKSRKRRSEEIPGNSEQSEPLPSTSKSAR